jgi:hypothetical protein
LDIFVDYKLHDIPALITTPKISSLNKLNKQSVDSEEDEDDDNDENCSNLIESPNNSNDNTDEAVKKVVKKKPYHHLIAKEQNELTSYIRSNLFRRLKIVNDKYTHSIGFECFDHFKIMDGEKRSLKYRNVLDFINATINARRNYLKHQILRVMQGTYDTKNLNFIDYFIF